MIALFVSLTAVLVQTVDPEADAACQLAVEVGYEPSELRSLARTVADDEGVDQDLFLALVTAESDWDPDAVSPKGAMGLTQLLPGTAADLGITGCAILDPETNLRGGARYLAAQLARDMGEEHALASYNAGPGRGTRPPSTWPSETKSYVAKVLRFAGRSGPSARPTIFASSHQTAASVWVGGIVNTTRE